VATGSGGEIILVHAIATYADCADKNTVAVKAKSARKNRDPIRQTGVRRAARECNRARIAVIAGEAGKHFLLAVKGALQIAVDAGRIIALRKETDAAHGHGHFHPEIEKVVARVVNDGTRFLDCDVPAEQCRFACAKGAKDSRRHTVRVGIVDYRDERLHGDAYREPNTGAGNARLMRGATKDARHL